MASDEPDRILRAGFKEMLICYYDNKCLALLILEEVFPWVDQA